MPCAMTVSKADALKSDILKAGYSILNSTNRAPTNADFHSARYALYSLAAANADPAVVSHLSRDIDIHALRQKIFPISCEAGVVEECAIAEKMLNDPALDFDKATHRLYRWGRYAVTRTFDGASVRLQHYDH